MRRAGNKPGRRESPPASSQEPATPERSTPNTFAFAPASTPQSTGSPEFNLGRSSDCSPGTAGSWLTKGQASPSEAINPSLLEDMWFGRPSTSQTSSAAAASSPGLSPEISSKTPATADSSGSAPSRVEYTLDQAAAALKEQAAQSGSARIPFRPAYHTPLDKAQPVPPVPHSTPADAAAAAAAAVSPDVTSAAAAPASDTDVDVPSHKGAADQGAAGPAPGSASKASPVRDQNTPAGAEPWGHLSPQVLDFGSVSKTLSPDSVVSIGSQLGARTTPTQLDFESLAETPEASTPTLLQRNRSPVPLRSPSEVATPETASPVLSGAAEEKVPMSPGQRKQIEDLFGSLEMPEAKEMAGAALFGGDASQITARLDAYKDVEVKAPRNVAGPMLLAMGIVLVLGVVAFTWTGPPMGMVPSLDNAKSMLAAYNKGMAWEAPAPATGWRKFLHTTKFAIQDIVDPGRAQYSRVEPALAETLQVLRRHKILLPEDAATAAADAATAARSDGSAAATGAAQPQQQAPQEVSTDTAPAGDAPAAAQEVPAVMPPAATEVSAPEPQPAASEVAVTEAPVEQPAAAPAVLEQEAVPVEAAAPVEAAPAVPDVQEVEPEVAVPRPSSASEHQVAPPAAAVEEVVAAPQEAEQDTAMPVAQEEVPGLALVEPAAPAAQPTEEPAASSNDAAAAPSQEEPVQQPAAPEEEAQPAAAMPEQQLDSGSAPAAAQAPEAQAAPAVAEVAAPVDTAVLVEPAPEALPGVASTAEVVPAATGEQQGALPPTGADQQPEQLQAPAATLVEEPQAPAAASHEDPLAGTVEEEAPLVLEYVSSPGADAKPWDRAEVVADERLASQFAGAVSIKQTMFQATNLELPPHTYAAVAVVVLAVIGLAAMYLLGWAGEVSAERAAAEADVDAEDEPLPAASDLPPTFDKLTAPRDESALPAKIARRVSGGFGIAKQAISDITGGTGATVDAADDADEDGTTSQPKSKAKAKAKATPSRSGRGRTSKAAAAAAAEGEEPEGQHAEVEEAEQEEAGPSSSRGTSRRKSAPAPRTARKPARQSELPAINEEGALAAAAAEAAAGSGAPALDNAAEAAPTRGASSRGRAKSSAHAAPADAPGSVGPASTTSGGGRAPRGGARSSVDGANGATGVLAEGDSERPRRTRRSALL